jgi:hypothetical protein
MSELVVVTVLMPTTTVSYIGGSSYLCDFCNVTLIKSLNVEDKLTALNTKNEVKLLDHLHLEVIIMKARHLSR